MRRGIHTSALARSAHLTRTATRKTRKAVAKQRASALLQESEDKQAFAAAVQDTLACCAVATDLERVRMQLEDVRAQMFH